MANVRWDRTKDARNRIKHGLSFSDFSEFDSEPVIVEDNRRDYGECRLRAYGRIGGRPFMIVFVDTDDGIRLISFRRAHEKELRRYVG